MDMTLRIIYHRPTKMRREEKDVGRQAETVLKTVSLTFQTV